MTTIRAEQPADIPQARLVNELAFGRPAEADGANNSQIRRAGGILPPVGLWMQVEPGSALIFLGWEAVADRRVASYRVYRAGNGSRSTADLHPAT